MSGIFSVLLQFWAEFLEIGGRGVKRTRCCIAFTDIYEIMALGIDMGKEKTTMSIMSRVLCIY